MLTQRPIIQHSLVDHTAKLTKTKALFDDGEIFLYSRSWLVGQRNGCWIKGLGKNLQKENGMSAKVRVRISRIMPQNVSTRPPFYSWKKFCVYTRQPTRSGLITNVAQKESLEQLNTCRWQILPKLLVVFLNIGFG